MKLSSTQVKNVVASFFLFHGKFPPGTNSSNWQDVLMGDMQFDDPPLEGDPHFEKKKLSVQLQQSFNTLGASLKSPLSVLKKTSRRMRDLVKFCDENQGDLGLFES